MADEEILLGRFFFDEDLENAERPIFAVWPH